MTAFKHTTLSILDLAPIVEGGTAAQSFRNSLDLAQHAEKWGYNRYWLAEHHNMPGIASSATSLVIGYIAAGTQKIRVGSGGIMLSNHAPLVIAEQFGTLESMYPGRIDLGLGRAPGSDPLTARALRRGRSGDDFAAELEELRAYLEPLSSRQNAKIRAVPGEGLTIPIWLLGSSDFSARLAAHLGLPFAFASHFAPDYILPALQIYRNHFQPSAVLERPYVMVGMSAMAADTNDAAKRISTSAQQQFLNLVRGRPGQLQPPVDDMDVLWNEFEKQHVLAKMTYAAIGDKTAVQEKIQWIWEQTMADELIVSSQIYDHQDRLRSYKILSDIYREQ